MHDNQPFDSEAYCNGAPIKVTRNCSDILRCLRKREGSVTIWLDQICVNQSSDEDKNVNLARMDEIYENCTKVLIWMTGFTEDAVLVLRRILDGSRDAGQDVTEKSEELAAEISVMRDFQFYPWHERMWTLQEVVVPTHNDILLLTRSGTLPLMTSQSFVSRAVSLARLQLLRLSMGNWPGMEHWKLSSILQYTLDGKCYLPQDKIYALYGILKRKSPETARLTLPTIN
ncbi:hypothetical protein BU23DRAFT_635138 [Bimuria novae-zelandiae CBS 107.79]|uniref:Heterokaryon incompatibility domain-containing protein n=1 Tax=Bimuria novae-zelandiae CBS 107.79 TaxID=1447943 RepID=A0A6A5VJ79_9PLEO|nr:hypothetical protein BU23DRAFT_635138 [Bimuria novae-zelandiae CBS 107.79]